MTERTRLEPLRMVALVLSLAIGGYFTWGALTDAPAPKLAWIGVVAIQCLNVGILLTDRRRPDRAGEDDEEGRGSYKGMPLRAHGFLVSVTIAALLMLGAAIYLVLSGPWRP